MATEPFKSLNYDHEIPDVHQPFAITCPPDTDVWDKPPSIHSFNAPIIYQSTDVSSFKSARVTISANWTDRYDQGGLCLIINPTSEQRKWVKTGVEFLNGQPHVSTVATDRWSDWSLRPMPSPDARDVTIEIESKADGSLWVYVVGPDGTLGPMREVTWWGDLSKDTECWVGVYAAKPAKEKYELEVHFKDFSIETTGRS